MHWPGSSPKPHDSILELFEREVSLRRAGGGTRSCAGAQAAGVITVCDCVVMFVHVFMQSYMVYWRIKLEATSTPVTDGTSISRDVFGKCTTFY